MKNIRFMIQIIVLLTVSVAALNHYLTSIDKGIKWFSESTFHYICPICGVTSIYQFIASSSLWVVKVKSTLGLVISLVIILSVLFGPVICGFICPFGAIQDITARIGKKILKNKYNTFISSELNKKIKYIRYVSLIIAIILTGVSGGVILLEKINPYHAYLSIFNRNFSAIGFIVLGLVISASLIIHRPWCRYLCPYGALLGLTNKIKVFRIVRKKESCVGCRKCSRNCPMGISVNDKEAVRDISCISCMECIDEKVCPRQNTIMCTSEDFDQGEVKTENLLKEDNINLLK